MKTREIVCSAQERKFQCPDGVGTNNLEGSDARNVQRTAAENLNEIDSQQPSEEIRVCNTFGTMKQCCNTQAAYNFASLVRDHQSGVPVERVERTCVLPQQIRALPLYSTGRVMGRQLAQKRHKPKHFQMRRPRVTNRMHAL
jgi:hypothetical protein